MHHLTVLIDSPKLTETLITQLNDTSLTIHKDCGEWKQSDSSLFQKLIRWEWGYDRCWYCHGGYRTSVKDATPPTAWLYNGNTLSDIDTLIEWSASSFEWAILPWGGWNQYRALLFISADSDAHDLLLSIVKGLPCQHPYIMYKDHVVASYVAAQHFTETCHAVLCSEFHFSAGMRMWDVCGCNDQTPCIVAPALDELSPNCWRESFVANLTEFPVTSTRLSIFKPDTPNIFNEMCRNQILAAIPMMALPDGTDYTRMANVISPIFSNEYYTELQSLEQILANVEWYYSVGNCHPDSTYSFFASKNPTVMNRLARSQCSTANDKFKVYWLPGNLNNGFSFLLCFSTIFYRYFSQILIR